MIVRKKRNKSWSESNVAVLAEQKLRKTSKLDPFWKEAQAIACRTGADESWKSGRRF